VLLAAGSSARLGKPKQLLVYNGKSLLQHSIEIIIASGIKPFIIVLGANADLLNQKIVNPDGIVVLNNNWNDGMATSINAGLTALLERYLTVDNVIFMTCDQPFVTKFLLNELIITHQQTGNSIVASSYDDALGVPALFSKTVFPELLQLKGDAGAKKIILQHIDELATVSFPKGEIDIDTVEDYETLLKIRMNDVEIGQKNKAVVGYLIFYAAYSIIFSCTIIQLP